jgi:DNA-binding NtrC family response regulator
MATALLYVSDPSAYHDLARLLAERRFDVVRFGRTTPPAPSPTVAVVECSASPAGESMAAIGEVRAHYPAVPLIALATRSTEALAIAALRAGARGYIRSPATTDEVARAIRDCGLDDHDAVRTDPVADTLVGSSDSMRVLTESVRRAAATDSTVLLTGETGTGKELIAQLLHKLSRRRERPFVCVNCAAIPDTLLESELFGFERGAFTGASGPQAGKIRLAHGGTLFLDEIGDMSLQSQAKVLRAIETREVVPLGGSGGVPVSIRIIAATNQDLETLAKSGSFRMDLMFRLDVVRLHVPPLRERAGDIPALARHFLGQFNRTWGHRLDDVSDDACRALARRPWPGNVRELRNSVEAAYVNAPGPVIRAADVCGGGEAIDEAPDDRRRLCQALTATNWNLSKAAELLSLSRMTIYRKLARYQLSRPPASNGNGSRGGR